MPAFADGSDEIAAALGAVPAGQPVSEVARRLLDLFTAGPSPPARASPGGSSRRRSGSDAPPCARRSRRSRSWASSTSGRDRAPTFAAPRASCSPRRLRWGLIIGERSTSELLELRTGLETYVARLAAERPESGLDAMQRHLATMRASVDDLGRFAKADRAFHQSIAIAGNDVIDDLLHVVRSLLQIYADRAVRDAAEAQTAIEEHAAVLAALERHDADAAASAMARPHGDRGRARRPRGVAVANSPSGESMADRIVRVLETFTATRTAQTIAEIGRRAGLPRSTAHRVVSELVAVGLLDRDEQQRVRIGIRLWELSTRSRGPCASGRRRCLHGAGAGTGRSTRSSPSSSRARHSSSRG